MASKTWSLIARSSLSDVCDALPADRFSLLGSCFSMLGCVWYLADRRLLHPAFNSLLTAFYVILSTGRAQLIFASRCSLMAVRCSLFFFADQCMLLPARFSLIAILTARSRSLPLLCLQSNIRLSVLIS